MLDRLFIALQFLTILPINSERAYSDEALGGSLPYYPLVGLLIGMALAMLLSLLQALPALVAAAVLLTLWIILTGALHLDGLADSADAWIGGLGDRERTMGIMKDPYCGPIAAVTLMLTLMLKLVSLEQLISGNSWQALLLIPLMGRAALVLLFLTTPYVRAQGLGSQIAVHLPRKACGIALLLSTILVVWVLGSDAIWLLLIFAIQFSLLRWLMIRRLQGTTGDTAGALVELSETALLLSLIVLV